MSPAIIRTKTLKNGKRSYSVYFRRGGRAFKQEYAGTFKSLKDAKIRRDLVGGWLAGGQDPAVELNRLKHAPARADVDHWFQRFIDSRVDVAPKTLSLYRNARDRVTDLLGEHNPTTLTPADIQDWVNSLDDLAPQTIKQYLGTLRQALDYADIEPNPARSRKVRLPADTKEEVQAPTSTEWNHIREKLGRKHQLIIRLIECTGLRITEALSLTYGDIDFNDHRLRVSRARTKGRTAGQRWLPIPQELLNEIGELVPLEDRHRDRLVFQGLADHGVRADLTAACKLAKAAHYSPHALRHRRVSLWVAHGIDAVQVKTWSGHTKASMSFDVYSHINVEPHLDEWRRFWIDRYLTERRGLLSLEVELRERAAEAIENEPITARPKDSDG